MFLRIFIIFYLAISALPFVSAQEEVIFNKDTYDLKGKVKFLHEVHSVVRMESDDNTSAFNKSFDIKVHFDKKGTVTELATYHRNGAVKSTVEFDANGQQKKEMTFSEEGEVLEHFIYVHNRERKLIEFQKYNGIILEFKHYYSYRNGKLSEDTRLSATDSVMYDKTYLYDEDLRLIETRQYDHSRNVSWRITYEYNSAGKRTKMVSYNSKNEVNYTSFYQYDEHNKLVEEVRRRGNEDLLYKKQYVYDKDNRLIEKRTYDIFELLVRKDVYTYARKGYKNKTVSTTYTNKGLIDDIHHVEFDKSGNEIAKKHIDENGELVSSTRKKRLIFGMYLLSESTSDYGKYRAVYKTRYNLKGKYVKTKSTHYFNDGRQEETTTTAKYKHDKRGNLLESTTYQNGKLWIKVSREIKYW